MFDYKMESQIGQQTLVGVYSPSNLPFLQAQILERIYINISKGQDTTIEELSLLTDYPATSKILWGAIGSLIKKGFLTGSLDQPFSFSVPKERIRFFQRVIERCDYAHKHYSKALLDNFVSQPTQLTLFFEKQDMSELNKHGIVHKWYNYLEDFPYRLIEDKIREYNIGPGGLVLDPFCGSGTTLVSANMFNIDAIGFDTSPLMAFVSRVKTDWDIDLDKFRPEIADLAGRFLERVKDLPDIESKGDFRSSMPKKEINQWLSPILQREVSLLKHIISATECCKMRNLFLLALSKSCFNASYVSLCPGATFYPFREKREFWDLFTEKIMQMYDDLRVIQSHDRFGKSKIINDTCLNVQQYVSANSVDFIITSPPYPNDLEYTRQTRLELYLLDFVKSMKDIKALKKKMVKGSTKLIFGDSNSAQYVDDFDSIQQVADKIREALAGRNWGWYYPRMIREYFGDMYLCLQGTHPLLANGAHFLLVVGNQTVKGVLVPVGDILVDMAERIGYRKCRKELFRTRRSTTHRIPLPEEIVVLEK